jgi:hypothetical protein
MNEPQQPAAHRWIKTPCGRAKLAELAARSGPLARLRLGWFVLIGALRDWRLADPDRGPSAQEQGSDS